MMRANLAGSRMLDSSDRSLVQSILVPRGLECRAVRRGLRSAKVQPIVVPIPIGMAAVKSFLANLQLRSPVLVMGLCGSLQVEHQVGDALFYDQVILLRDSNLQRWNCSRPLTQALQSRLPNSLPLVNAWTSEQFIHVSETKQQLGQTYGVAAVDMEGAAILEPLSDTDIEIAMLRVVSDDCHYDLPDLTPVINPVTSSTGQFLPLSLLVAMSQTPQGTARLLRGVAQGLRALQNMTALLFA